VATPAPPPKDDRDEGLLDDVEEVVDRLLGEDLEPPGPEDPWERRARVLDSLTTFILGVAAVATAWATFQAGQWSERSSDSVAAAATSRSESVRAEVDAGRAEQIDTAIWLNWVEAVNAGQERRADFLARRFPPTLATAQTAWLERTDGEDDVEEGRVPPGTPFALPEYRIRERARAEALVTESERELADAQRDGETNTLFVSSALILALVLFFAAIAPKSRHAKVQAVLVLVSIVLLGVGLVRILTLPQVL
jgi:hypothetical protein